MRLQHQIAITAFVLSSISNVWAQSPADPSGHWTGTIQIPDREVAIEIDLAKGGSGDLGGTIGVPSQNLKGLPLLKVVVDGSAVSFHARSDQTFAGRLSDDAQSMSGDFTINGSTLPFSLVRSGDAKLDAPLTSPPITKELEGTWSGSVEVGGTRLRVVLAMANQADGRAATGRLIHLDEGGLEIPVAISQKATHVTLQTAVVAGSFAGDLNASCTELAGTWTKGENSMPITFRRGQP